MKKLESTPDLYVLDMIADDAEDLATIMSSLNGDHPSGWRDVWGRDFNRDEVVQSLSRLIKAGMVRAALLAPDGKWLEELPERHLPPSSYDEVWFAMTPHGRVVHSTWDPERGHPE